MRFPVYLLHDRIGEISMERVGLYWEYRARLFAEISLCNGMPIDSQLFIFFARYQELSFDLQILHPLISKH